MHRKSVPVVFAEGEIGILNTADDKDVFDRISANGERFKGSGSLGGNQKLIV